MWNILVKAKWLLSGNILFAFSQWLMLIMFSHFSNPLQLGYYAYALSITAPIFIFSNLQLRPLFVADFNSENKFNFSEYLSLRILTVIFAVLVSLCFVDWNDKLAFSIIFLVILIKAIESLSDILYAYYNANNKTKFISQSLTFKAILVSILSFLILYLSGNIYYSLIGTFLGYFSIFLFLDLKKNIEYFKNVRLFNVVFKEIIKIGMPLGVAVMLVSLQVNIPRYFLEKYEGVELVGVFTILSYFVVIGGIVINSICQYLSPNFSKFYRDMEVVRLKRLILSALSISLFLGMTGLAISLLLSDFILNIIYGSHYIKYSYLLPYIMVSGIFTYLSVVNGYLLTSLKILKPQMFIFLFLVCLTTIYSCFLIPLYGLNGAIFTTILSSVSQFVISSIVIYKKMQELTQNV